MNDMLKRLMLPAIVCILMLCCFAVSAVSIPIVAAGVSIHGSDIEREWGAGQRCARITHMLTDDSALSSDEIRQQISQIQNRLITDATYSGEGKALISAYSAQTTLSMSASQYGSTVSVKAIAVGGDFFRFHPFELSSGWYPRTDDINDDSVLLDDIAAWQLFGALDVAGLTVYIDDLPYIVSGVAPREKSDIFNKVYGSQPGIYMVYSAAQRHEYVKGAVWIELMLPNPVDNYARDVVKNVFGSGGGKSVTVESSSRFSLPRLYKRIGDFASNSMRTDMVVYPWWENLSVRAADISAMLLLAATVSLGTAVIIAVGCGLYVCREYGITPKNMTKRAVGKIDDAVERRRAKKYYAKRNNDESSE